MTGRGCSLRLLLFGLPLLADEGGDELDDFVLLAARESGDFFEYLLDFAGGTGLRLFRFAAEQLVGGGNRCQVCDSAIFERNTRVLTS